MVPPIVKHSPGWPAGPLLVTDSILLAGIAIRSGRIIVTTKNTFSAWCTATELQGAYLWDATVEQDLCEAVSSPPSYCAGGVCFSITVYICAI